MVDKAFRASQGLDAADNNVINVADPRDGVLSDGVNQNYFIINNTVQPYDPTRDYAAGFIVDYNNRLYIANRDITAEAFNKTHWTNVRVDPVWKEMSPSTSVQSYVGDYITLNTSVSTFTAQLPASPEIGEMVVFHDRSGSAHLRPVTIARNGNTINGTATDYVLSTPYATLYFIYTTSNTWAVTKLEIDNKHTITSANASEGSPYQLASGENVYARTSTGKLWFKLPRYPNDQDVIKLYDLDAKNPVNYTQITVNENTTQLIETALGNVNTVESNLAGMVALVYDSTSMIWRTFVSDLRAREITVDVASYQAEPEQYLFITHQNVSAVSITLPIRPASGDWIEIIDTYSTATSTVTVQLDAAAITAGITIRGNVADVLKQQYSNVPKTYASHTSGTSFTIPEGTHGVNFRMYYKSDSKEWVVGRVIYRVDVADSAYPSRPGLIPLATQTQANAQNYTPDGLSDTVSPDTAITPKTLDTRRSTETLAGIARIATATEMQVITTGTHRNDVIVTPQHLNERQATETIRGLAEIATQTETRSTTLDTHIITPQKFHAAQAEEALTGVAMLVTAGGLSRSGRVGTGTGVFEIENHTKIVTPKMLDEYRATEYQPGTLWIANATEINVNDSTVNDAIITPAKFAAWKATTTIRGIVSTATQTEVNATSGSGERWNNVFVTPETLNSRTPTESRRGVVEIATQAETNLGTDDIRFITPLKFSTWLSYNHFSTDTTTGLNYSGNIWNGVSFDISAATETQIGTLRIATQTEANAQSSALDTVAITPLKLNARRSTTTQYGIARIATDAEIDAGTVATEVFVTPAGLLRWTRTSPNSRSTSIQYGTSRNATLAETWVGDSTAGSSQAYTAYITDGFYVSPRGLNHALQNYLPLHATADNSQLLDSLDSTQFARSDTNDTISGVYTFTANDLKIQGASPRLTLVETDNSNKTWFLISDSGNYDIRESGTTRMRINAGGATTFSSSLSVGTTLTVGTTISEGGTLLSAKYLGISANAVSASKWQTARTITFGGDLTGSFSIDGSGNVTASAQVVDNSHNHSGSNITSGIIDSARTVQATTTARGTVQLTSDRTGQSETLAATQKSVYELDQTLSAATLNKGTYDYIAFRDYIQVGSVRISANSSGILEFGYGYPIA